MAYAMAGRPKYFELIDGKRYAKVSPQRTHSMLQGWLISRLRDAAGTRGEVGSEWKFYLGGEPGRRNALQPDVSFVSYERITTLTRAQAEKPRFAPDIAIEILSPDDRPGLLRTKIARYLGKGARAVVVVDPEKRLVVEHTPDSVRTIAEGKRYVCSTAPWFDFDLTELFESARWRGKSD